MAARTKDKRPPPTVVKRAGKLVPASAYDAERLDAIPDGAEFDAVERSVRSLPHHRLYWAALDTAVRATGRWATPEALHTALKVECGRVEPVFGLDGKVKGMIPDSTSFAAMGQREFAEYFGQAMAKLAEAVGFDPLSGEVAA